MFAARALQPLLFQTTTANPVVYGTAALLLFITTLMATFLPVRRAVRIDPGRTLREE
jgi:ABC-type lipoprotein release transport system permease subunit